MATPIIKTELTYRVECNNLDEKGFKNIGDAVTGLPGARKQALGMAPKVEIETYRGESYDQGLSFIVAFSAKSADDLKTGLLAYMSSAGTPHSVKGAYELAEEVLGLPKFNKTLEPYWFSFFTGKLVVDLPKLEKQTA